MIYTHRSDADLSARIRAILLDDASPSIRRFAADLDPAATAIVTRSPHTSAAVLAALNTAATASNRDAIAAAQASPDYCHHCDTLSGFHFRSCPQYQPAPAPDTADAPDPDECPRCGHTFDCYCAEADALATVTDCQSANRDGADHTPTCNTCHDAGEIDPRECHFPITGPSWPCPACSAVLWSGVSRQPDHASDHMYISAGLDCTYVTYTHGDGPTYWAEARRIDGNVTAAELIHFHAST